MSGRRERGRRGEGRGIGTRIGVLGCSLVGGGDVGGARAGGRERFGGLRGGS